MKTHLSLTTCDLDAGVKFYKTLLQVKPLKHYDDYALFITEDPGLELALTPSKHDINAESAHYGIAVSDAGTVDTAIERLRVAGYATDVEREETCCYAEQTKVWTVDPDGRHWEVYTVLEEAAVQDDQRSTCCADENATPCCCNGASAEPAA
jgi:catechol 2,3-dioxygenase-like lactoylglutathione lyase family enzyme